jgi:hypothetical protein
MRSLQTAALLTLALSILASPAARAAGDDTVQRLTVPLTDPSRPATVKVSTIHGGITVTAYGGRDVVVEAVGRGEPTDRKPPKGAEGMQRVPNHGLSADEDNNVVRVETQPWRQGSDLRIQVPVHSSLHLSCVNGCAIHVSGVEGELELSSVNGSIEALDVSGSVVAHTTNGGVKVVLKSVETGKPMAFSTLNGDVDVTFPAGLKANVMLRSDRGDIYSDFEIASGGHAAKEVERSGRRHLSVDQEIHGTIGGGGPEILFKTFNGDILIHRSHG